MAPPAPTQVPASASSPTVAIKTEPVDTTNEATEMNGMQHNDPPPAVAAAEETGNTGTATIAPAPPPARKDRNLREFLDMMEEHAPIVRVPPAPPPQLYGD